MEAGCQNCLHEGEMYVLVYYSLDCIMKYDSQAVCSKTPSRRTLVCQGDYLHKDQVETFVVF